MTHHIWVHRGIPSAEVACARPNAHGCLQEPVASNEGLGGTYFFSSEAGGRVGIMKPVDEEPLAPNNPKARSLLVRQHL